MSKCFMCGKEQEFLTGGLCSECAQVRILMEQKEHAEEAQRVSQEEQKRHNAEMERLAIAEAQDRLKIEQQKLEFERAREEQRKNEAHEKDLVANPAMAASEFEVAATQLSLQAAALVDGDIVCKNCGRAFSVAKAEFGEYCCKSCLGDALGDKRREYIAALPQYYLVKALASPSIVNTLAWLDHLDNCEFTPGGANVGIVEHLRDLFEAYDLMADGLKDRTTGEQAKIPFEHPSPPKADLENYVAIRMILSYEQNLIGRMRVEEAQKPHPHTFGIIYAKTVSQPWLRELLGKNLDSFALELHSVSAARKIYLRNVLLPAATLSLKCPATTRIFSVGIFWVAFPKDTAQFEKVKANTPLLTWQKLLNALFVILSSVEKMTNGVDDEKVVKAVEAFKKTLDDGEALQSAVDVMVWLYDRAKTSTDLEILEKLFRQLDTSFSIDNAAEYAEACEEQAIAMKRKEIEEKKAAEKETQEKRERQLAERMKREQEESKRQEENERFQHYQYAIQLMSNAKTDPFWWKSLTTAETIFCHLGSYRESPTFAQKCKRYRILYSILMAIIFLPLCILLLVLLVLD